MGSVGSVGSVSSMESRDHHVNGRSMGKRKNSRRKTQVTASNAARSDKIGVNELKLVVNNSKKIIQVDLDSKADDLIMGGWSLE